jgi:hypothetical protein
MKLTSLAVAAVALSLFSVKPASADFQSMHLFYLGPELPNYLTLHGPARCTWADYCWYVLMRGPEGVVAAPVAAGAPRVKK